LKKLLDYIPFLILGVLYTLLPTQNANIDSWFYAACIKYNAHLFNSHHLLYNILGNIWHDFMCLFYSKTDAISSLNLLNAISATIALMVFYKLLLRFGQNKKSAQFFSLTVGVCFGYIRFATDAETYILPVLFSILSTYFYFKPIRYLNIAFSALFAMLAVCTHQLHIWWTLAIYFNVLANNEYSKNKKIFYSLVLFSGVILYYLVYFFNFNNLTFLNFILGEYQKGNAGIDFSLKALALTLINVFRTVFQVHGFLYHFALKYSLLSFIIITIEFILIYLLVIKRKLLFTVKSIPGKSFPRQLFLIAIILHLFFAFISSGNAEFMAMLPFLFVAYITVAYNFQCNKNAFLIPVIIFIWNIYFGLIPLRFENINKITTQVNYTRTLKNDYFLWSNKPLIENKLTYETGFYKQYNFTTVDSINVLLKEGKIVYTDLSNTKTAFSRESMLNSDLKTRAIDRYALVKVDSFENLYGKNYIYKITSIK
jgi:hypothetical protein